MIRSVNMHYQQGSSDKLYNVWIEQLHDTDLYLVNFSYGRRGSTLTSGTKTNQAAVVIKVAEKIFNQLVQSKVNKGYQIINELSGDQAKTAEPAYTVTKSRQTDIHCQLLNPIEEWQLPMYMLDDNYWLQEKYDGKRLLIKKDHRGNNPEGNLVYGINRNGLTTGIPGEIYTAIEDISEDYFLFDGELVDNIYWVFDLLKYEDKDLRNEPYETRHNMLDSEFYRHSSHVKIVPTCVPEDKEHRFNGLKSSNAEGIVLKDKNAPYTPGRPASGGPQVKFKFYETASVIVDKINQKRSVKLKARKNGSFVDVGNVTIPPNKDIPNKDDIIEVRYLYAYRNGSLYQPTYLGVRDDIPAADCTTKQFKFKREEA